MRWSIRHCPFMIFFFFFFPFSRENPSNPGCLASPAINQRDRAFATVDMFFPPRSVQWTGLAACFRSASASGWWFPLSVLFPHLVELSDELGTPPRSLMFTSFSSWTLKTRAQLAAPFILFSSFLVVLWFSPVREGRGAREALVQLRSPPFFPHTFWVLSLSLDRALFFSP